MLDIDKIKSDDSVVSRKTGHSCSDSKDHKYIIKYNKHNLAIYSFIEYFATKVIHQILPNLTPDIDLVTEGGNYKVVGVAVRRQEGFVDFSEINLIHLLADIELKSENRFYSENIQESENIQKIEKYFSDKHFGEVRRDNFLRNYYLTVFTRSLLQEDDQHKANVGFYWSGNRKNEEEICAFAIDFDLLFQESIGANFNMVRLSQWGSPYGKFKITFRDIVNFPFIKDSIPGHHPGIEANSLEAKSISSNKARYTKKDVEALEFISKIPRCDKIRKNATISVLEGILNFDLDNFRDKMDLPQSLQIQFKRNILTNDDWQCNFAHIFEIELAKIQLKIYKALKDAQTYDEDPEFRDKLINVRNKFRSKLEPYASDSVINEKIIEIEKKYKKYSGLNIISDFKKDINVIENDFYLHLYEKQIKVLAIKMIELITLQCNIEKLNILVDWWSELRDGFIVKSRESSWLARRFKNYFYNHNVTTYVTLRDILIKRTLDLRAKNGGNDHIDGMMVKLLKNDSILDSHSERPLSFFKRIELEYIRLFYSTFKIINLIKNYCNAKSGWELILFRSVILAPAIILKDVVKSCVELLPFILQCIVRYPRRFAADGMRYLLLTDVSGVFKFFRTFVWLICASTYLIFTMQQMSLKVASYIGGKITSPILSAERDSKWIFHTLIAYGVNLKSTQFLENVVYFFSLLVSGLFIFTIVKISIAILTMSSIFCHYAALYKILEIFSNSVTQLAISIFVTMNMILQVLTNKCFNKKAKLLNVKNQYGLFLASGQQISGSNELELSEASDDGKIGMWEEIKIAGW